jgi:hypothetical protein
MSYVTLDHLRPYLIADSPAAQEIHDQPIRLTGVEWIRFHGSAIDPASLIVKSRQASGLTRAQLTLASGPVTFSDSPIVDGTLLVASNSSLSRIYRENVDYTVDTVNRTIAIRSGSAPLPNQSVTIWFEPYTVYRLGEDYYLNGERGEIRRSPSGEIADGQSVLLDFAPVYAPFSDEMLNAAITEANGLIEREIDPDLQFGADPTLIAAARSLALEIICRAAAARELASGRSLDKVAIAWSDLADSHASRAEALLKSFRPPMHSPKMPTIS